MSQLKPKLQEFIREKDVLVQWGISKATMLRARRNGLPFYRLGAFVCYKPDDLAAYFRPRSWSEQKTQGLSTR